MKLRRSLLASAVPAAVCLACAGPALAAAAPAVSVRVEGATRTLLSPTTVTAPSTGSITKGKTPAGQCPADSAAGALNAATHGRWNGSYFKGLGIDVSSILGTTLSFSKGSYWGFYVNDRLAAKGVCDIKPAKGQSLLFAAIPAKGKAPRPLVVTAPATVTAGKPFSIRTFVYAGKGNATRPVTDPAISGSEKVAKGVTGSGVVNFGTSSRGVTRMKVSGAGTVRLLASAPHTIRAAAVTIKVTK